MEGEPRAKCKHPCERPNCRGCVARPLSAGRAGTGEKVQNSPGQSEDLASRLCSVDVSEVFSPPRVGKEASKFGLEAGDAMDLTTGWDFNREEDRVKAEERVDAQKPLVLIGSPPCVAFSQLQTLIPDSERKKRQLADGDPPYGVHGEAV